MAAIHNESDEIVFTPEPNPTEEYYGICSVCHGDGEVIEFDERGRRTMEECGNCGGDGKSIRRE